ncbi:ABC-type oligopeptide transport system, ATPase component [Hahella chejuensis KCTC 2396]|uniref:ABC-type oligopeptide transport system, ATPase component n=1 Tax=Hahella chejuensis (strain KCTC 2396) TaxID=349521 RepID=Q2S756_HAHCH|nr:ABC transporter ATP-binding protein [Hahella chejuensis]ABC33518.1 ABC-type oligopeptide transport system, ATPase component [Hahella chejuensis KCTC 2396]
MMAESALLRMDNVSLDFKSGAWGRRSTLRALRDVSLSLQPGKALALVGESGSGKSTCARLLSGLHQPTEGDIFWRGVGLATRKSKEISAYRRCVQMIFQDPFSSLNPALSVGYQIERPLLANGIVDSAAEAAGQARILLERVGLHPAEETAAKRPHELSGGQRQRVAIARALAVQPEVILADEPTSMLDVSVRIGILNLLLDLKQEQGISFLFITHDLASARYFADDIAVLYGGSLVEQGDSDVITQNPQHPYTRLLLNSIPGAGSGAVSAPPETDASLRRPDAKGCPFAHRCPQAIPECRESAPALRRLSDSHSIRCHLY